MNFIYPPFCLHCHCYIREGGTLFCSPCTYDFSYLPFDHRSPLACFAYRGAVTSLIRALKSKKMPYLAKTAAAFLFLRFVELSWPTPDFVVPVPCRSYFYRNDHVYLMALYLARRLGTKSGYLLRRTGRRPPQRKLTREGRLTLTSDDFRITKREKVTDKCILLVDDVMTTKSTLRATTLRLEEGGAKSVYAFSVAESLLAPVTWTRP